MSWFLVDDRFHAHPKVYRCSLRAVGLWAKAGSWCKEHLTDGFIPKDIVRQLKGGENIGVTALAQELCNVGLWIPSDGGWQFHQWTGIQGSRAEALARRAQDTARKAAYRASLASSQQSAVRPDKRGTPRGIRTDAGGSPADVPGASDWSPSVLSSPSPSPLTTRDLTQPPPLPTLTGSTRAHAQNENGGGGGGGVSALELSDSDKAAEAYRWLHAILLEIVAQPAPRVAGRWLPAYRYIGAQPSAEWLRVEACLRSELTGRRLKPRACTPGHVADYWQAYAAGEPPGARNRPQQVTARVGTAEEFARGAENNPDWVTEETGA